MTKLLRTLRQDETEAAAVQLRLAVLLAVDVAVVAAAAAAAGAFHVSLAGAVAAAVSAVGAVGVLPAGRRWAAAQATQTAAAAAPRSFGRTKKILVLVMAAGAIAVVGGRGTFAIFTAETSNSGNSMSSGTLVLGDKLGATVCYSYGGSTKDNVNSGCSALLSPSDMAPGVSSAQAKLTIENDGSLDAGTFYLSAPWPRTSLSTPLASGVAPSQLVLSTGLNVPLATGDTLTVSYAGNLQSFTVASPGAVVGATTIPLQSPLPANYPYPAGSRVEDTSGDTTTSNMDCYDQTTTNGSWPASGSAPGSVLPFVTTTGNPLCSAVIFWVQEQTNGVNYCWYGRGAAGSPAPSTIGQCRTPTTATLGSALTSGSPVPGNVLTLASPLTGNVKTGDVFTISENGSSDSFTASADAYIGDTQISIDPWSPNYAYDGSATIEDTTAFDALNNDTVDTIAKFDTGDDPNSPIQLHPLTANTTAPDGTATISLGRYGSSGSAGYQRTFYIGVYMPAPSGQAQNQLQGLMSTFGLTWHIGQ